MLVLNNEHRTQPVIALVALLIFLLIAAVQDTNAVRFWDHRVLFWFYAIRAPGLVKIMSVISFTGTWMFMLPATICTSIGSTFVSRKLRIGLRFGITMAAGWVLLELLKFWFGRPRPQLYAAAAGGYGFPSGHSFIITVFMIALLASLSRLGIPTRKLILPGIIGLAWIIVVGISRLYLLVHYPSDVAAGWVLGLAFGLACMWFDQNKGSTGERARLRN